MNLDHIDLSQSSWSQSLFRRMGFVRRFGTTGKVSIPEALRKELETQYLHDIVRKIEENNIPPSLVLNLDQKPSKYLPIPTESWHQKEQKLYHLKDRIITEWLQQPLQQHSMVNFYPCS